MTDVGGVAVDRLRSFIERVERLEEEKAALAADIREVYSEAKGAGFDVKTMRQIIRLRKMEKSDRDEQESLLDLYRHAISMDGRRWRVSPEPCLVIDQDWEHTRLFYPTVLKIDGVYLMWYGSYWKERASTTATGFAVSLNGLHWNKHPYNPVLRPADRLSNSTANTTPAISLPVGESSCPGEPTVSTSAR